MGSVTIGGALLQILPLTGEEIAKRSEGEVLLIQGGVPPPAYGRLPLQGEDRAGIRAIFATAFKPAVFCSHLVARKGRKASDRCGGGG